MQHSSSAVEHEQPTDARQLQPWTLLRGGVEDCIGSTRIATHGADYGLIPQLSPTSRRLDFHALRKSAARILIELGVHPKLIQMLLRHSDIRLTMDLYGELGEDDLFREQPKLPVPRMFTTEGNGADGSRPLAVAE